MNRRVLILSVVLIIGIGVWFIYGPNTATNSLTTQVKKGSFDVTVTTTGELKATNSTNITAPMGLRDIGIWQIKIADLVDEGTKVTEGDIVAELDKTEVMNKINEERLNLNKKLSEYEQAKLDTTLTLRDARTDLVNLKYEAEEAELKKSQNIYEAPSVLRQSELDLEKAERSYLQKTDNYKTKVAQAVTKMQIIRSDLQKVQNRLNDLMETLEELNIKAPKSGMVIFSRDWEGNKKVVGSMISTWEPNVAELPDLTKMESITFVNEVDIQKVKTGQEVNISFDAIPNKKMKGTVKTVASIGEQKPNSDAKVFEVNVEVIGTDTTLRPGMTTSNEIVTTQIKDALYLPIETVVNEDGKSYVYMDDEGDIVKQEVKIGVANEANVQLLEGVKENDTVYLSAPKDTAKIKVKNLSTASDKK